MNILLISELIAKVLKLNLSHLQLPADSSGASLFSSHLNQILNRPPVLYSACILPVSLRFSQKIKTHLLQ